MQMDVYVSDQLVGVLDQVDLATFSFAYFPGTRSDHMVSLLMPVRAESWVHRFLHPVFQVSLPEGSLRQLLIQKFAKHFNYFGDVEMLATVGSHLVGRVKVVPRGTPLAQAGPPTILRDLLKESSPELINHYVSEHLHYAGVSGGFLKFLAKSPTEETEETQETINAKAALMFDHWIVKLNDVDRPHLALNEYFGMTLARKMGLPVPDFHLSEDYSRIAIKRFDVTPDGKRVGFEDMAAMLGLNASDKFSGSVERIIKTINSYCKPMAAQASREQFFAHYLACSVIRNGDAHLKNFGMTYTSWEDVKMAPVFDMVSMSLYAPRAQNGDALDEPALSLGGVKRWLTSEAITELGKRCLINPSKQAVIVERLCSALEETANELRAFIDSGPPGFDVVGKRLLELWSHGIRVHNPALAERIKDMGDKPSFEACVCTDAPS